MATQDDYEACPFCGGHEQQPLIIVTKKGITVFCVIECLGCYAQGPRDPDVVTTEDARRLWNKRTRHYDNLTVTHAPTEMSYRGGWAAAQRQGRKARRRGKK